MELEQARYEARLASRRYEAVDPDNRLVAGELEARWNAALSTVGEVEQRLRDNELPANASRIPDKETLCSLAQDLPAVWNSPATDMRLKQRIVRILIEEIIADVDDAASEIVLLIHWTGGRHSELRMKKNLTGRHSRCTDLETIEVLRRMSGRFPDDQIAATLNRLGLKTGTGNTWNEGRVRSVRSYHELPAYNAALAPRQTVTLEQASERLGISHKVIRRLIESNKIPATQVVPWAPWEIPIEAIESAEVVQEVARAKRRPRNPTVGQLGPGLRAGLEHQEADRLAAVTESQHEQTHAAILAAVRVADHGAGAVINLGLLTDRSLDHRAGFLGRAAEQFAYEALDALIAAGEAAGVDQILPDGHGVAAAGEPQFDSVAMHRTRTGRR